MFAYAGVGLPKEATRSRAGIQQDQKDRLKWFKKCVKMLAQKKIGEDLFL